jgi:non-heme chloroperoxidase
MWIQSTLSKKNYKIMETAIAITGKLQTELQSETFLPGPPRPARSKYIEVAPNVRLHVTDAGEGRAIVLLHGWPLSDEMYEYQYDELAANDFRVIGITLRGFGKSDKPLGHHHYHTHVQDIEKVLEELQITDCLLGGFALGGEIAVRFAAKDQDTHVAQLALFGAGAPSLKPDEIDLFNFPAIEVDAQIALCYRDRPELLLNIGKIVAANTSSFSPGISNWLNSIGINSSAYAMEQCLFTLRDADLTNDFSRIKIPTLIMHSRMPVELSAHSNFLEESRKFNAELIQFAKAY